jgi:hypothetical protein
VLVAEKARDSDAMIALESERQQHQRLTLRVARDCDDRFDAGLGADVVLPTGEQIEALIGRQHGAGAFKATPGLLRSGHVAKNLDVRHPRGFGLRSGFSHPAFDGSRHGHTHTLPVKTFFMSVVAGTLANKRQQSVRGSEELPPCGGPESRLDFRVRSRHPAYDRHRRQHPADAGHDVKDRLIPSGGGEPRRLRDGHAEQRPHDDEDEQGDRAEEFPGADGHDANV